MQEILRTRPDLAARIRPYIGGEDLNSNPSQSSERYAIYLCDIEDEVDLKAAAPLAEIVREKVYPERMRLGSNPNNIPLRKKWWAYQAHRPVLQSLLRTLKAVIVTSRVSPHMNFSIVDPNLLFNEKVVVICSETIGTFSFLQSRTHEVWARTFCSTLKDDLNYSASDCFETFAFPKDRGDIPEDRGRQYLDHRTKTAITRNEGLTKIYNRFHDPAERAPHIQRLRELHHAMDVAVLRAYNWDDLADRAAPEFLTADTEPDHRYQGRLFWPAPFREEVLGRLLDLNRTRAEQERRLGVSPSRTAHADVEDTLEDAD